VARAITFDPDFGTATQAVAALRRGAISSCELTAHVFARIKKHDPALNCFVTLTEGQAMARAKQADAALRKKKPWGELHGLPIVVKDVFATEGVRTTSGSKSLEKYTPKEDAAVVARLKAAGAVIIGKTNVPEFAADWQSYNDVGGVSNNPWDVGRTPGGSTGGGAAALAAGLGFLEIGSDLAGSIRVPAHFCGIYGHKPTWDLVPMRGHIPPPPGVPAGPAELPVVGPLARSAEDLLLELGVVAGPDAGEAVAYRWSLPRPRKTKLGDYRIGYVIDDPFCPLDSAARAVLSGAIEALRKRGARLTEGWPPGVDPGEQCELYGWLLAAFLSQTLPDPEFKGMQRATANGADDPWVKGTASSHREWLQQSGQRLQARAVWQEYFKAYDAFLMPIAFVPAFPHDHTSDMSARRLMTTKGARPYGDMSKWISFATLTGCPATVAPLGRTPGGLKVGIQIMGPYLEDATPIDIAARMADLTGGFVAPPTLRAEGGRKEA
jgi:amidase